MGAKFTPTDPTKVDNNFLSANHIAAALGEFEPQRTNNFTLIIPFPTQGSDGPGSPSADDSIRKSLRSFPFPTEENAVVSIPYQNTTRKVAGIVDYGTYGLVVTDYFDSIVLQRLFNWRRKIWSPTEADVEDGNLADRPTNMSIGGAVGLARNYKTTGTVILHGPDGNVNSQRAWNIHGMWPSSLSLGEGDYSTNEDNRVSVTFIVDYISAINVRGSLVS